MKLVTLNDASGIEQRVNPQNVVQVRTTANGTARVDLRSGLFLLVNQPAADVRAAVEGGLNG